MPISSRERKIVWLTLLIVGAVALWLGVSPIIDSYVQLKEELGTEKQKYESNRAILMRTKQIEQDFRRVEAQFPDVEPGRSPDFAFSEDVAAAADAILPDQTKKPTIDPVKPEPIKSVSDYEFLNLTMRASGEYEKLTQLLKGFDQKGFLVKAITLDHSNPDRPELSLDLMLARIVKLEAEQADGAAGTTARSGFRRTRP